MITFILSHFEENKKKKEETKLIFGSLYLGNTGMIYVVEICNVR